MGKIDDLMEQVGDARFQRGLGLAVAELKKRTRFGLVYESHLPERTVLPGLPITSGCQPIGCRKSERVTEWPVFVFLEPHCGKKKRNIGTRNG